MNLVKKYFIVQAIRLLASEDMFLVRGVKIRHKLSAVYTELAIIISLRKYHLGRCESGGKLNSNLIIESF